MFSISNEKPHSLRMLCKKVIKWLTIFMYPLCACFPSRCCCPISEQCCMCMRLCDGTRNLEKCFCLQLLLPVMLNTPKSALGTWSIFWCSYEFKLRLCVCVGERVFHVRKKIQFCSFWRVTFNSVNYLFCCVVSRSFSFYFCILKVPVGWVPGTWTHPGHRNKKAAYFHVSFEKKIQSRSLNETAEKNIVGQGIEFRSWCTCWKIFFMALRRPWNVEKKRNPS